MGLLHGWIVLVGKEPETRSLVLCPLSSTMGGYSLLPPEDVSSTEPSWKQKTALPGYRSKDILTSDFPVFGAIRGIFFLINYTIFGVFITEQSKGIVKS